MGMTIEESIKAQMFLQYNNLVFAENEEIVAFIFREYEQRLKADKVAILTEIQLEIHELENPYPHDYDNLLPLAQHNAFYDAKSTIEDLVEQKIDKLKEAKDGENNN